MAFMATGSSMRLLIVTLFCLNLLVHSFLTGQHKVNCQKKLLTRSTKHFFITPDQVVDIAAQSDAFVQGANWFIDTVNTQYQDVLAALAQKYSDNVHSLENVENIRVRKVDSEGFNVEVVYRETETLLAVDVPIAYPHGRCSDVQTAVAEFQELAASTSALGTEDRLFSDIPREIAILSFDTVMTPELQRLCENLTSMINRSYASDLVQMAKSAQPALFEGDREIQSIEMQDLNPVGFMIALSFAQPSPENVKIAIPFKRKCMELSDFQQCIGELC